jgi:hypothetical protein
MAESEVDIGELHEDAFVDSFIARERRGRWRQKLRSTNKRLRSEFLWKELIGHSPFDEKFEYSLDHLSPDRVLRLLRSRGAPSQCYLMTHLDEWDRQVAELQIALESLSSEENYIVSCIPGRLAYFFPIDELRPPGASFHAVLLERN